ncbi:hypothetical protein HPB47_000105, partial [Ixodes persulcatus]
MYGPPHLILNKKEVETFEILLQKAIENSLGLPEYAATRRLLELRFHNTFEELARAKVGAQVRRLGGTESVDAAGPVGRVATAAVAHSDGSKILTEGSFRVSCATEAEESAIALAVTCNPKATIISDSQGAVHNFAAGSVGEVVTGLLRRHRPQPKILLRAETLFLPQAWRTGGRTPNAYWTSNLHIGDFKHHTSPSQRKGNTPFDDCR